MAATRHLAQDLTSNHVHFLTMSQSPMFFGDVLHDRQFCPKEPATMVAKHLWMPRAQRAQVPSAYFDEPGMPH